MQRSPDDRWRPRDILRALWNHKKKALCVAGAILALAAVGLAVAPRRYASEAKLLIRPGRESIAIDPTATTGATLSVYETRETEMNSVLEVLRSRGLAEAVVDEIGPAAVLGEDGPVRPSWLSRLFDLPVMDARERASNELENNIDVWSPKRSTVITVRCKSDQPQRAQFLLDAYLDVYIREHLRVNRTRGSHEFFVTQSAALQQQLQAAQRALNEARNDLGIATLEGQRRVYEEQMASLQGQQAQLNTQVMAAEAKAAALREQLAALPDFMLHDQTDGLANGATDAMRAELYRLEIQERDLLSRFTESHPMVVSIRRQVASARRVVEQQEPRRRETRQALNPVYQQVQASLLSEEAQGKSLRAQRDAVDRELAGVRQRLKTLNQKEAHLEKLQRDANLLAAAYESYMQRREQSRIDQALAEERISNVNIVHPATHQAKPISPPVRLFSLLAVVTALCGAVGTALCAEHLAGQSGWASFRSPRRNAPSPIRESAAAPGESATPPELLPDPHCNGATMESA